MDITLNKKGNLEFLMTKYECLDYREETKVKYLEQFVQLMNMEKELGDQSFHWHRALISLLSAGECAEKQDDFHGLVWLNECHSNIQSLVKRITERTKPGEPQANKKTAQEGPDVNNCSSCGGKARLMYRGYLPFYMCSQCGREGELSEETKDAAYKWNSYDALKNLKEAVDKAERCQISAAGLKHMAIGVLEQIYKEGEGLHGELDKEV